MNSPWLRSLFCSLVCWCAGSASAIENVTLQLKWKHAFQFAGYYAALDQGYYRDVGLNVRILEADPATDPVQKVVSNQAQYGVGTSSLLLERAAGKPVVVLAVIFQQSPYEIYAAPNIHHLRDLIGKRLMLEPQSGELLAYLKKEGIPLEQIHQMPHSFDADGLMKGYTDAISGYISNEPYYFRQAKYPYQTFSPRSAGIDFYGDNLFTSEQELRDHPERVKAFRAASLRGWKYAKEHHNQIINLILAKYAAQYTHDYLDFESDQMIPLLQPNLIEIGYMNPSRWQDIASTYADIGLLKPNFPLKGFLYDATEPDLTWFYRGLAIAALLIIVIGSAALSILRINRKLNLSLNELHAAQHALSKSERHYRQLLETMQDVVWILDPETLRFHYVSPSVQQLRGYTAEEVMREPLDTALTPEFSAILKQQIQQNMARFLSGEAHDQVYIEEVQQPCKDGSMIWTEALAKFYLNEETGKVEIHGVTRDISERKAAQDKIHFLAMHDPLTGLPTRNLLNDRLEHALTTAKRDHTQLALMFLDLDKFKPVNDRYGHDVGDLLLQQVASRILTCVSTSDTVARIGGDEFIVLLPTIQSAQVADNIASKICEAMRQPFECGGHQLQISCSIGIALYPEHGKTGLELLKQADIAMYASKDRPPESFANPT
ncbi:MAG: diguanylate cyclase [Gallionella sp.]|nr:diguanylate cyclase [Gallionella sp.]